MARVIYFDCFSGASGDMILGALIDAGLPLTELQRALGSLALTDVTLKAERVDRSGIAATNFRVVTSDHPPTPDHAHGQRDDDHHHHGHHDHDHDHDHTHSHVSEHGHADAGGMHHQHDHPHRGLTEITRMVDASALSETARARAKRLFHRLAQVEAEIHQQPVETIHLHEVGAVDSIIDIAGAVFGLEWVGADYVVSSPLNVGAGTVRCAHGVMPVPAPATAKLITDVPVYSTGVQAELLTPTGALLVTDYAQQYGPMPAMRIERIGYGAGDRDLPGTPNVLRVMIGETDESSATERVVVLECEIDDMNPQIYGVLMERLYAAGALDVYYAPIQMKKNRPGTLVSVVAAPGNREALSQILFRETTSLGVRFREMSRERLERSQVSVPTPLGPVRFKVARYQGEVVNAAPEFDDCARLAATHNRSVKDVQAVALKAYLDRSPASS